MTKTLAYRIQCEVAKKTGYYWTPEKIIVVPNSNQNPVKIDSKIVEVGANWIAHLIIDNQGTKYDTYTTYNPNERTARCADVTQYSCRFGYAIAVDLDGNTAVKYLSGGIKEHDKIRDFLNKGDAQIMAYAERFMQEVRDEHEYATL